MKRLVRNSMHYMGKFLKRELNYYLVHPTNLLLFMTYRCTSQCKSCTMWQRKPAQAEMSLDEWKRFIDMAAGYGIQNVELFGGDALLRKDVVMPLVRYIREKGIPTVELVTNCNLLDETTIDELFDAGIGVITTSLDGVGDTHDFIRGVKGSFERTRRCLEYMTRKKMAEGRKKPKIVVNCTVSALNVDSFEQVLPFAITAGADNAAFEYVGEFPLESVQRSMVNGTVPTPFYLPQGTSIRLSRDQAVMLKRKMRKLKEYGRTQPIYINSGNIDVLTIDNMVSGVMPNKKCYICRYLIVVDPSGNVIPCPFFNNYTMGNVRETALSDIWDGTRHQLFRHGLDVAKVEVCKYCILSVERNPTLMQSVNKMYLKYLQKGFDEQEELAAVPPGLPKERLGV